MTSRLVWRTEILFAVCLMAFLSQTVPAQTWWEPPEKGEGTVDRLRVDAAITLGVEFLKKKQRRNGSFPGHDGFPMGMTALCLLTLVKSGVQPQDPAVTRALDYLRYLPFKKTYSTGCMLMALEALHPKGAREWAEAGVSFLLDTRQAKHGGTWGYPDNNYQETGRLGRPDLSNTQYAILGLRSARRLGLKVPATAFTDVVHFLIKNQKDLGAFHYEGGHQPSGSMTTAGLAILTIAEQTVGKTGEFARVRADVRAANRRAMAWFERHYTVEWNPHGDHGARNKSWLAYYLYGIERLCDIQGIQKVAGRRWYDDGARFLLANQGHEGNWGSNEDTCFALLFLSRSHLSVSREIRTEAVADRRAELKQRRQQWEARVKPPAADQVAFLRDWLVLGSFRVKEGEALDRKQYPRPRGRPAAGAVSLKKRWQLYRSPDDAVDLEKVLKGGDLRLAYVATHLHVPRDEKVLLWLGTRDAWRIWVNGKAVDARNVKAMNGPDRWRVPCSFQAGVNTVIMLLEDHAHEWTFWFRITDLEGLAVPGLLHATSVSQLKRMAKRP